jgi:hypothetical protein
MRSFDMKLRSTLAVALALMAGVAQAQVDYLPANNSGAGCVGCAGGGGPGSGAEAWLVPRPGPQGYSHPATTVYAERCCRDHYPGCCDNVWDGYCSERQCWHGNKGCGTGCYGYGYASSRWGYGGWSGGGWNPAYAGSPVIAQQQATDQGWATTGTTSTWSGGAAPIPTTAQPVSAPTTTPSAAPQPQPTTFTPAATGAAPSARNWSGYPRSVRTW